MNDIDIYYLRSQIKLRLKKRMIEVKKGTFIENDKNCLDSYNLGIAVVLQVLQDITGVDYTKTIS